jgi:hypothetical protein
MLSRIGVLVVGVTSVARERGRERERESPCVSPSLPVSFAPPPFYRYKEMPSCTMGCSYVLTWLAEMRLEPCTRVNVAVGEVP